MKNCFYPADLLLPRSELMERWAVIACDQYTSDKEYWDNVAAYVSDHPSAYNLILPEAHLSDSNEARICAIHDAMDRYLSEGVLEIYPDSYIYVERTLLDGSVRQGIVGAIDLEQYSFSNASDAMVLATEQTVLERIPPRMAVRKGATIELSHVIVFYNDPTDHIMSHIVRMKESALKLYDFDLMQGGGHITGWLIDGENREILQQILNRYVESCNGSASYLVADGNHSLATAKKCYEMLALKDRVSNPARFAMIELENIHSAVIEFEPIHRILTHINSKKLLEDMQEICKDGGYPLRWISGSEFGEVLLDVPMGRLPLAVFQDWLDAWIQKNDAQIDYIHDDEALVALARSENAIGFFMPKMDKNDMFTYVASGSILPRKAFSLGHAAEKRYYLEGRKIK